jgi:glycosyltransferase involved in cell wall biosynthesis
MLEAAAMGKPMIVTRTGALEDYFDEQAVLYVEPFNVQQMREAVDALIAYPARALSLAREAGEQLRVRDLTVENFARQHVQLTREMLAARDAHAAQADGAKTTAGARAASQM